MPFHVGMRPRQESVEVTSIPGIDGTTDHLDVLLRHRLLRKPGGFEGLGSLHDAFDADHGHPSKGPDLEVAQLAERVALATGPVLVNVNDHAVSSVDELVTRDHKTLPLWKEYLTHVPGHLISAAVHPLPPSQA